MPREIQHDQDYSPVKVFIKAMDSMMDGASHQYRFEREDGAILSQLNFHHGELSEINDVNGVTMEAVLAVVLDRLATIQESEHAHKQYGMAQKRVEEAIRALGVLAKEKSEELAVA